MRGQRTAGITKLPDGAYRAIAYSDTSPELKKEILNRVPDDMGAFIKEVAARFGKLDRLACKWRE